MGWTRTSLVPLASRPRATAPPAGETKLNLFQRTMLRWGELHPYSAAHAVRVAQPLAPARLQQAIASQLAARGLTGLVLDARRGALRREGEGGEDPELRILAAGGDPVATVWAEFETELNTPFSRAGRLRPFRFFAVPAGDGFYLGLVYDHFIAAGDATALLLTRIVGSYTQGGTLARAAPPSQLASPRYRRLLLHHPVSVVWAMLRLPSVVAGARRAIRPPRPLERNPYNGVAHLRLGPDEVAGLRHAAEAWGVTLNDVLLASLLQTLAPLAAERTQARRRRELAVASIVNIRQELPAAADALGPFLASFQVSHALPAGIGLRELARDVHAESARIRHERLYLRTIAGLGVSGLMWPFLSPGQRERFFPKYHPVWGGVSMLNVKALWAQSGNGEAEPAEYLRAISTGPACPLVLAVTVLGDVLEIGLSFRLDAFSRVTVEGLRAALQRSIAGLRGGTPG